MENKKLIAYFDLLGFKSLIENNTFEDYTKAIENLFYITEMSLSLGKTIDVNKSFSSDLSNSNINCIVFSDTIIFWCEKENSDNIKELLDVTFEFSSKAIRHFFPVRGALNFGEFSSNNLNHKNQNNAKYNVNSVYGKALVDAYLKAENQSWAGTTIDLSVIKYLDEKHPDLIEVLAKYTMKYKVPVKNVKEDVLIEETTYKLITGNISNDSYLNHKNSIRENFGRHNKVIDARVELIIENTLEYLKCHIK
jgi:hypothetical protein